MNKIHGEHTRRSDEPSLCDTCRGAMTIRGTRFGDDVTKCTNGFGIVRFKVTACSGYSDNRLPHVYELELTAWRFVPSIDRFVSPAEFMRLERAERSAPPSVGGDVNGAS